MIARLTIVTTLAGLFAFSFAALVESAGPTHAKAGLGPDTCLDRGLVCGSER